jgi:hypothetical protein
VGFILFSLVFFLTLLIYIYGNVITGCLSSLMREGYAYAGKTASPGGSVPPMILESSSSKSRDRYQHLGFEVSQR